MSDLQGVRIRHADSGDLSRLKELSRDAWPDWWKENPGFGAKYARDRIKGKNALIVTVGGAPAAIYSTEACGAGICTLRTSMSRPDTGG